MADAVAVVAVCDGGCRGFGDVVVIAVDDDVDVDVAAAVADAIALCDSGYCCFG